jgi:hypothetical protein
MFFIKNAFAVVWGIDKIEERYAKVRIGTSEKDQQGKYVNSNWFSTFVGKAREKVEALEPRDRITITTGKITNISKKQEDGTYKTYLNVVVFDFEMQSAPSGDAMDNPPKIEDSAEEDDDLPF